jgi:hypothetical protein
MREHQPPNPLSLLTQALGEKEEGNFHKVRDASLLQERKGTRAPQPFVLPPQNIYALHSPSLESRKRKNTSSPTHSCATLEIFVFNMSIKKYINTAQSAVKHFFLNWGCGCISG